jgi:hypothetical protein
MTNSAYSDDTAPARSTDALLSEASTALPMSLIGSLPRIFAAVVLAGALGAGPAPVPVMAAWGSRREEPATASSVFSPSEYPWLDLYVKTLFDKGAAEFFSDGVEGEFYRSLVDLLARYGNRAISAIADYLFAGCGEPEVVSEALRWLADHGGPETLSIRFSILLHGLNNTSPAIRDGAILGLTALDDPRAEPSLLRAGRVEEIKALQRLIEQAVSRLTRPR